jgi:formate dehydrogenase
MGACDRAPVARGRPRAGDAGRRALGRDAVAQHVHAKAHAPKVDFAAYRAAGGYTLFGDCLSGKRTPDELIKIANDADLRGLGGAGFPTGASGRWCARSRHRRLMAVNGDEGEPGTFKDRHYSVSIRTASSKACCLPPGWSKPPISTSTSAMNIRNTS